MSRAQNTERLEMLFAEAGYPARISDRGDERVISIGEVPDAVVWRATALVAMGQGVNLWCCWPCYSTDRRPECEHRPVDPKTCVWPTA